MQHENILNLEEVIFDFVSQKPPQSFILYAGAGAGKTHTLHQVLIKIKEKILPTLTRENKKLAIITYTNVACDEIKERVDYDTNFFVSTIHSFAWSLIEPFTREIKEIISNSLNETLREEELKLKNARDQNNKTNLARKEKIARISQRLELMESVKRFTYNPNGAKVEKASLDHSEVIEIFSRLLLEKKTFRSILVNKYPILFLDESQDTYEKIINSLVETQKEFNNNFIVGLFGDNMQRIFPNNKNKIDTYVPNSWQRPQKTDNWRCPKRVVDLINRIRLEDDHFKQEAKKEIVGFATCIIVDTNNVIDKLAVEKNVRDIMYKITEDECWKIDSEVKKLILEHHMAAIRSDFYNFYKPLYDNTEIRNNLNGADTQALRFLIGPFLNLVSSIKSKDEFNIIFILKNFSEVFVKISEKTNQLEYLKEIRAKKDTLFEIISQNNSIREVLSYIYENNLLNIPPILVQCLIDDSGEISPEVFSYGKAINTNINNLFNYANYINGESSFSTHQGVKGLEFDRVMAILDDDEAGGFLFSYNKLLGIKELSERDLENETQGLDSAISRTRRLFYVICSRAKQSLAVVCYTKEPNTLKDKLIEKKWFDQEEIYLI
ncbi:UvrD-helicase domain-containing protein [Acinetobacter baumannii]|uniref:UvrD-helicase domain-containing protein n=1 Tax=Acinetobacter baumannii TaxID=470 RepID=UPI00244BC991|nr:UvrD-helicase domain-containing protein [Acinetobacter baumannii]MDH2590075.1 AAA family ATPase [Acinetobacter baumannii]